MGYYSAIRKNDILPFAATRMELEGIMLSEVSQIGKDKCHVISLLRKILKNKKVEQELKDTENRLVGDGGWGVKWEKVGQRSRLAVIK